MRIQLGSLLTAFQSIRHTSFMKENLSMIHTSRLRQWALGLLALVAGSASLPAIDITFDFTTQISPVSSFTLNNSGFGLTFSNPNQGSFQAIAGNGIEFGANGLFPTEFDIQVTGGALVFKNYQVGNVFAGGINPFDLTGGTGTSTGNSLSSVGVFNYNGSYAIAPGQTVRFTSSSSGVSNSQLKYMTFSTVPEPSTYALGAIATGVMAAVARRRKAAKV